LGSGERRENGADFDCPEVGSRPRAKTKTFGFLNDFVFDWTEYHWIWAELWLAVVN
jgi:hypothetical protein